MQVVKLSNGLELPLIGLGTNTFGKVNHNWNGEINFDTSEIESALRLGYTFLDTAIVYRNEAVVGLGYKEAGVLRNHVFLQTKLPSSGAYIKDEESIREALGESLHKLSTSYIDVVLMHQPRPSDEDNLRIYRVLEKLVDEGRINTIGVSNFSIAQLDYLLKHARIKPAINQIEVHPGYWNEDLVDFCKKNNVLVQAWSPLFRTSDEYRNILIDIGKKYQKSWAQVVIRYLVEKGIMVIAKSHQEIRQAENLNVFDFALAEEDRQIISGLNKANFPKVGVLGATGFVGKALTSEALRLGYQVAGVSLNGKVMPMQHLTIIKEDVKNVESVVNKISDVDFIISSLNARGEDYISTHLNAVEIARKLKRPLVVIGTFANLKLDHLKASALDLLEGEEKDEELIKAQLLEELHKIDDVDWTYISPSRTVDKYWLHHNYNIGGRVLLKNRAGESEVSVIDLVNFALTTARWQKEFNHQQLTICNR